MKRLSEITVVDKRNSCIEHNNNISNVKFHDKKTFLLVGWLNSGQSRRHIRHLSNLNWTNQVKSDKGYIWPLEIRSGFLLQCSEI